jgi:thiamine-phosphate pyrophosphorylase
MNFSEGEALKLALSEETSRQTLRLVDANLNRASEGLRVLEDIARLMLNEAALTQQLKTMRHKLVRGDSDFQQQLLDSRDSVADVGRDTEAPGEEKGRDLSLVLVANSRRVQESLRVLEELAKMPALADKLDSEKFKQARFNLYTLEQALMSKILRQEKTKRLSGLYVIIDTPTLQGRRHVEVARQAIRGGAKIIQLRDKTLRKKELLPIAHELKNLCTEQGVFFIMNDYLDLALETEADGLHLGQEDLPVSVARKLLPIDRIVGCSTTTVEEARAAQAEGADYIAVGSIFPTSSKETAEVVGLKRLHQVRTAVSVPLVAIGGITKDNVAEVIATGANAVAVISAVLAADSPEAAAREIVKRIEAQK